MKSIRNRLNNYARYILFDLKSLRMSYPGSIYIEPTNHCVLKCKYCLHGIGMKRKKGFMDLSLYKKIINDIKGKIKTVYLIGQGEPLLHKHLPVMIKYAKQNGHDVRLNTSGVLLNKKRLISLIDAGLDSLYISFDTPNERLWIDYKGTKRTEWYKKTVDNVNAAISIASEHNRPRIRIGFINYGENFKFFKEHINAYNGKSNKIVSVAPQDLINMWGALNDEPSLSYYRKIRNLTNKGIIKEKNYPVCWSPWVNFIVYWNGEANACSYDANARMIVGNANYEKVSDIWNNKKMKQVRSWCKQRQFDNNFHNGVICKECNVMFSPVENYSLSLKGRFLENFYKKKLKISKADLHNNWRRHSYNFKKRRFEIKKNNNNSENPYELSIEY